MTTDPEAPQDQEQGPQAPSAAGGVALVGQAIGYLIAVLLVLLVVALPLAVAVGFSYAVYEAFPTHIAHKAHPGLVDTITENRFVVFAIRTVLLSAAAVLLFFTVYVVASMVVRMKRGEWLVKAGPFEAHVKAAEESLEGVEEAYRSALNEAWETATDLEQRLEERTRELEEAYEYITSLTG